MRFTIKTEYGIVCLLYLMRNGKMMTSSVTVPDIVKREHFSKTFIEKILQALRRAKIVASHQGVGGGYVLAREPAQITLKEIVEALEGSTFDVFCEPRIRSHIVCTHFSLCGVQPIWQKTKEILDRYYDSVTLEMIAKYSAGVIPAAAKGGMP